MKIISHRGNIEGPNSSTENFPDQINDCINRGYDVEIDLRIKKAPCGMKTMLLEDFYFYSD